MNSFHFIINTQIVNYSLRQKYNYIYPIKWITRNTDDTLLQKSHHNLQNMYDLFEYKMDLL